MEKAAHTIQKQLNYGVKHPFKRLVYLNGGQSSIFEKMPISFNRNVMSILLNKKLMDSKIIPEDHKKRAADYFTHLGSSDIGAYTASTGHYFIRENVSAFFGKRDGYPSDPRNLLLTGGCRDILSILLQMILYRSDCGILVPIPQFPMYTEQILRNGGHPLHYELTETKQRWKVDVDQLEKVYKKARKRRLIPRAVLVLNPGNPTGNCLGVKEIQKIVKWAHSRKVCFFLLSFNLLSKDSSYFRRKFPQKSCAKSKVYICSKSCQRYEIGCQPYQSHVEYQRFRCK